MKLKKIYFAKLRPSLRNLTDLHDMLRYDMAFQSTSDPSIVAFPTFKTPAGDLGGKCTIPRWHSFGVEIDGFGADDTELKSLAAEHPEQFVSYRHIPPDYGTLVPTTLAEALQMKDWRS